MDFDLFVGVLFKMSLVLLIPLALMEFLVAILVFMCVVEIVVNKYLLIFSLIFSLNNID